VLTAQAEQRNGHEAGTTAGTKGFASGTITSTTGASADQRDDHSTKDWSYSSPAAGHRWVAG